MYCLNALSTRLYYLAALSKQHTSSAPSSLSSIIFLQLYKRNSPKSFLRSALQTAFQAAFNAVLLKMPSYQVF
jgi:hypothetical protein